MDQIDNKLKIKNSFLIYTIALAGFVFLITLIRAATTAITWDEAYTYMAYAKEFNMNQLIDIHSNFANNHIINTIMIAIMDNLCNIPYNEFIIRLPNIIMLIFYFIGSYTIAKEEKHKYFIFTGLVLNYYVMEFFGLGRGYGIAASFVIWMCYFFKKAADQEYDDKNIFISVIFGLLACYANTVSILALFSICVIYLVQLIIKNDLLPFIKRNMIKIIPLVILLIYIIIFHFIVTGSDKPVFGEVKGMTIVGFLKGNFVWMFIQNPSINIVLSIIGLISILVSAIIFRKQIMEKPFGSSIVILLLALIIPSALLHKPYLLERCLIPLWPIIVLGIIELYTLWTAKISKKIEITISGSILILLFASFLVKIDLHTTRTWQDNYIVRDIAYQALYEQRTLTQEEYEANKDLFGLDFYRAKILEQYGFDIIEK